MPKDSVRTSQVSQCVSVMKTNHVEHVYRETGEFLGAFTNLRKAALSFVMSVRPSVRPSVRMEQLGSQWTDFH